MANLENSLYIKTSVADPKAIKSLYADSPLLVPLRVFTAFNVMNYDMKKELTNITLPTLVIARGYISEYHYLSQMADLFKAGSYYKDLQDKTSLPALLSLADGVAPTKEQYDLFKGYLTQLYQDPPNKDTLGPNETIDNNVFIGLSTGGAERQPYTHRDRLFAALFGSGNIKLPKWSSVSGSIGGLGVNNDKKIVHLAPSPKLETDPRRTGRYIDVAGLKEVLSGNPTLRDWILLNAPRYGLMVYGDSGFYYVGLEKAKADVAAAGNQPVNIARAVGRFSVQPVQVTNAAAVASNIQSSTFNPSSSLVPGNLYATFVASLTAEDRAKYRPRNLIKANTTIDEGIFHMIDKIEGGYFHPVHCFNYDGTKKGGFNVMGNSGETLFGIDRVASDEMLNPEGKAFFAEVDKWSGYGDYRGYNDNYRGHGWKDTTDGTDRSNNVWVSVNLPQPTNKTPPWLLGKVRRPEVGGDERNSPPAPAGKAQPYGARPAGGIETSPLGRAAIALVKRRYEDTMKNFNDTPELKALINSDGRLLFMYLRAQYNGSGWGNRFSANLKARWNEGVRDVNQLILYDMIFRYQRWKIEAPGHADGQMKLEEFLEYDRNI